MLDKQKKFGQVYTPKWIVDEILDSVGYFGDKILDKYIMEPASGDGAFLLAIVDRYIDAAINAKQTTEQIRANLGKHIYAIELDKVEHGKSIERLNDLVRSRVGGAARTSIGGYSTQTP